eukprot:2651922-Rhodomonas_salina.4
MATFDRNPMTDMVARSTLNASVPVPTRNATVNDALVLPPTSEAARQRALESETHCVPSLLLVECLAATENEEAPTPLPIIVIEDAPVDGALARSSTLTSS